MPRLSIRTMHVEIDGEAQAIAESLEPLVAALKDKKLDNLDPQLRTVAGFAFYNTSRTAWPGPSPWCRPARSRGGVGR